MPYKANETISPVHWHAKFSSEGCKTRRFPSSSARPFLIKMGGKRKRERNKLAKDRDRVFLSFFLDRRLIPARTLLKTKFLTFVGNREKTLSWITLFFGSFLFRRRKKKINFTFFSIPNDVKWIIFEQTGLMKNGPKSVCMCVCLCVCTYACT